MSTFADNSVVTPNSEGDVMNHLRIFDIVRWNSFAEAYTISILNVDILQPHASLLKMRTRFP